MSLKYGSVYSVSESLVGSTSPVPQAAQPPPIQSATAPGLGLQPAASIDPAQSALLLALLNQAAAVAAPNKSVFVPLFPLVN
jgi:hypothetical protein